MVYRLFIVPVLCPGRVSIQEKQPLEAASMLGWSSLLLSTDFMYCIFERGYCMDDSTAYVKDFPEQANI
jgi:hypothetical protein